MSEPKHALHAALLDEFGDDVLDAAGDDGSRSAKGGSAEGTWSVTVQQARPLEILEYLKRHHGYEVLADVTATDRWRADDEEEAENDAKADSAGAAANAPSWDFEVVYVLRCPDRRDTFLLKVAVIGRKTPKIPSATGLFPSAAWPEREIAEMFGITFKDHPDPRKLLLPENFEGHPLRKEYPLAGEGERESFAVIRRPEDA